MALDDDLLKELNGSDLDDDLASLLDQMVGADNDNDIEKQLNADDDLSGLDNLLGDYDDIFGMMNSLEEDSSGNQEEEAPKKQKDGFLKKFKESRAQKKLEKAEKKKIKKAEKEETKKSKKEGSKKKKGADAIPDQLELDLESELNAMQPELANMNTEQETSLDMDLFSSAKPSDLSSLGESSELDDIEDRSSNKKDKKAKKEKKQKKEKKKKELTPQQKQELELKRAAREQRREEDRADVVKVGILDILLGITVVVAIVCVTYFGSLAFSYHTKMEQATKCFVENNFVEAYELIGGMEVKEKDKEFYDQLICVMQVERSTEEFQSFYITNEYEAALNSLLVGVQNYEEILPKGTEIGVELSLKTSYDRILTLLSDYYGMTEADARMIVNVGSRREYQELVQSRAKNVKIVE